MNKLNLLIDNINNTQLHFSLLEYSDQAKNQLIRFYKVRSLHVEKLTVEKIEELNFYNQLTKKAKEIKNLTVINISV